MSVQVLAKQAAVQDRPALILALVNAMLAKRDRPPAGPEQDLREAGLSSLDTVNLMLAVEGEFDLFIPQADMTPEAFASVSAIAALVDRLA